MNRVESVSHQAGDYVIFVDESIKIAELIKIINFPLFIFLMCYG
jgi:hypothetical protein